MSKQESSCSSANMQLDSSLETAFDFDQMPVNLGPKQAAFVVDVRDRDYLIEDLVKLLALPVHYEVESCHLMVISTNCTDNGLKSLPKVLTDHVMVSSTSVVKDEFTLQELLKQSSITRVFVPNRFRRLDFLECSDAISAEVIHLPKC